METNDVKHRIQQIGVLLADPKVPAKEKQKLASELVGLNNRLLMGAPEGRSRNTDSDGVDRRPGAVFH